MGGKSISPPRRGGWRRFGAVRRDARGRIRRSGQHGGGAPADRVGQSLAGCVGRQQLRHRPQRAKHADLGSDEMLVGGFLRDVVRQVSAHPQGGDHHGERVPEARLVARFAVPAIFPWALQMLKIHQTGLLQAPGLAVPIAAEPGRSVGSVLPQAEIADAGATEPALEGRLRLALAAKDSPAAAAAACIHADGLADRFVAARMVLGDALEADGAIAAVADLEYVDLGQRLESAEIVGRLIDRYPEGCST